ncbi:hypothetical protein [Gordonia otitidis]|nr:hypothetical protein [Gordonia otitidis]
MSIGARGWTAAPDRCGWTQAIHFERWWADMTGATAELQLF